MTDPFDPDDWQYGDDEPLVDHRREPDASERRLALALETIGWRSASDTPADEVAEQLALILRSGERRGRDLAALRRDVAECLRQFAYHLDGSAASASDWEPAAARIIELYGAQ